MSLDIAPALYEALISDSEITTLLGTFKSAPSIHTRRPVPVGAGFPIIIISQDISISDEDALVERRPIVTRDITVYGEKEDQYRKVEECAYLIRKLFHRKKDSITVDGYSVTSLTVLGPNLGPTDDVMHIARVLTLTVRLSELQF